VLKRLLFDSMCCGCVVVVVVTEVFLEGNQAAERGNEEEVTKKKKKKQSQSLAEDESTPSGGASMLHGDKDDDEVSVEDLEDWKERHRDEDDRLLDGEEDLGVDGRKEGGAEEMAVLTLSYVLYRSGELNMQTGEVMEQWLLLIHHLAQESALGRQMLVNAYVDNVISKVANMQTTNVYLTALCEMCITLICTEEAEHFEL
jgi:hypothetical protein